MGVRVGDAVTRSDFSETGDEWSTGCSAEEVGEDGDKMEGVLCAWISRGVALSNAGGGGSDGFPVLCPKYLRPRSSFSGSLSSPGCRGSSFIDCDVKPLASLPRRFRTLLRLCASESAVVRLLFLMIVPTVPNVPLNESMPGCSVFSTITSSSMSLDSLSARVRSQTWLAPDSTSVAE